jgi:hypothetical protein
VDQAELLRSFVDILEKLRLQYLVTGSMATILYGEPRFTNDIDIVVQLNEEQVDALAACLPEGDYFVSRESMLRAVRNHRQFNVIHPASGLKVDVIVPAMDALDRSRFARARQVQPEPGRTAVFASPEDVILKKLQFHAAGGSERHLRDIAGVLKISGTELDLGYIERWVEELGLSENWRQARAAAR